MVRARCRYAPGRQAAGQDEGAKRLKLGIEPVDLAFEPRDLRGGDGQARATWAFALAGRRKIGAGVEQIVLNAGERRIERRVACCVQARDADGGIGLVKRAVGGDPQIIFLAPLAAAERGRAVVAGAGVDLVEDHHGSNPLIPAEAGIHMKTTRNATQLLGPRLRGDERMEAFD